MGTSVITDDTRRFVADTCTPLADAARDGVCTLQSLARGHYPGARLPPRALPGLRTVGFWDAPAHQSWHLDWHRNEGLELTFLERGRLPFATDSLRCTLAPGELTVTRPWQRHRVGTPPGLPPSRLHWLIVDLAVQRPHQPWRWPTWVILPPVDLARLTQLLRHCDTPVFPPGDPAMTACWHAIAHAVTGQDLARLTLHANELLVLLLETLTRRRPRLRPELATRARTVELFLADLPNHLAEPWTLESMAAACALGRTRFVHLVGRQTNATPARHLLQLRVDRATRLLKTTDRSITDIALTCGFGSSQYFATAFRRLTGQSPRGIIRER